MNQIRFIDSRYNDLFMLPNGGYIQVEYPEETVLKQCVFIDPYHTQVGNNVFHICEYAERMERIGAIYQAEPEIMGDEAAWKIGRDKYLAIQTCDEGYDYNLLNENFVELDGGRLVNPHLSMLEARAEILELLGLSPKELRARIYEEVMAQHLEAVENTNRRLYQLEECPTDAYAILQLKHTEETADRRFMSFGYLQKYGITPAPEFYNTVYMAQMTMQPEKSQQEILEDLYTKFNVDHPEDFKGHSLSVSDIVALKQHGAVSYHYVDSIGFKELPQFMTQEGEHSAE